MRFALIGFNEDAGRMVRAIRDSVDHTVRVIFDADAHREELFHLAPGARWDDQWEKLLVQGEADAAIVAVHPNHALLEEQLRKLAQEAVPLIIVHPLHDSLLAYELEMIRESAGGVMVGFHPQLGHPALAHVAEALRSRAWGSVGAIEQITVEHGLAKRERNEVLTALAQDLTMLRELAGELTSVNAVGVDPEASYFGNLAVSLTSRDGVLARWATIPAASRPEINLALIGSAGKAVLMLDQEGGLATLKLDAPGDQRELRWENHDAGRAALDRLQAALADPATASDWEGFCQDMDVAERVEKSLRRRRTIELNRESQTEEGTFKSFMAAGGCLLLLLALLLLVIFGAIDLVSMSLTDTDAARAAAAPRAPLWFRLWPVYPLVAFLFIQLLVLVAKRPRSRRDAAPSEN